MPGGLLGLGTSPEDGLVECFRMRIHGLSSLGPCALSFKSLAARWRPAEPNEWCRASLEVAVPFLDVCRFSSLEAWDAGAGTGGTNWGFEGAPPAMAGVAPPEVPAMAGVAPVAVMQQVGRC